MCTSLLDLPPEILHHLLPFLDLSSLASLSGTCVSLHAFVAAHGFRSFAVSRLSYAPLTVKHQHESWSWSARARWASDLEQRWDGWRMRGECVGRAGERAGMPVLKLWEQSSGWGRVVWSQGDVLHVWDVGADGTPWELASGPVDGAARKGRGRRGIVDDITGITTIPGHDDDLVISHLSGLIHRVRLGGTPPVFSEVARYSSQSTTIQSLSSSPTTPTTFYSISTTKLPPPPTPKTSLKDLHTLPRQPLVHSLHSYPLSPWIPPSTLTLPSKPWSLLSSPTSPWLATGSTAFAPTPTTDKSPVYGVAIESSKIWGVNERRAFCLDFESTNGSGRGRGKERVPVRV
ncbi:hypothetical protein MNV49_000492 [Pseudohyphozyma bogoriensis]|nr:hypothetical protein MNV49_000492 [Pseudohyphozyma bogoriensis]